MTHKRGFTLVEMVAVTLIIAVLALLVVPSFKNSALTNQVERAKAGLVELTTAVKLYNEVNPSDILSDDFDDTMLGKLTNTDQGYAYLQSPGRWDENSHGFIALKDTEGIMNCRYTVNPTSNTSVLSRVKCKFNKVDEEGTECYEFFIAKNNPALVQKSSEANCEGL